MREDFERRIVKERFSDIERQIKSKRLKEEACGEVESHFRPFSSIFADYKKMGYGPTDGRTDQWTDGPMDGRTYPLIEMRGRI